MQGWNGLRKITPKPSLQKGDRVLPASNPTMEPMAACRQMSGEEMNRATRNTPPVQGLSQPYTWPTPTGMACSSCKINRIGSLERGHKLQRPVFGVRTEPFLVGLMGWNRPGAAPGHPPVRELGRKDASWNKSLCTSPPSRHLASPMRSQAGPPNTGASEGHMASALRGETLRGPEGTSSLDCHWGFRGTKIFPLDFLKSYKYSRNIENIFRSF